MTTQGVIAESYVSFKITWKNQGNPAVSTFNQFDQNIEIHETNIYPDLKYISASGAALYKKYTSAALLNEVITEINKIVEKKISESHAGGSDAPKQDPNIEYSKNPINEEESQNTNSDESNKKPSYTVTVYGKRLRLIEGQQANSSGIQFLYKISNNLVKVIDSEKIDNTKNIWAEVSILGKFGKIKMEFSEFNEPDFKFGGNLLAQILPSVELTFTPDKNSVYAKEKPDLDMIDIIKSANLVVNNKTSPELRALQKRIQKELDSREKPEPTTQEKKRSDV